MKKLLLLLIPIFFLSGCTIATMRSENQALKNKIAVKQHQLDEIEQENQQLKSEESRLVAKLNFNRFTLDELNNDLSALIKQKKSLLEKQRMANQDITSLKEEIATLEKHQGQMEDLAQEQGSDPQKEKRINDLKEEIRNYLKLGLKIK